MIAVSVSRHNGSLPNQRMQPTGLSRILLLPVLLLKVSSPVLLFGSAARRLMRGPLGGKSKQIMSPGCDWTDFGI
jgi:hypothetical protein